MTDKCGDAYCVTCLHGKTKRAQYRPHTLTPDCWCQAHKDEGDLGTSEKRCVMEKKFAPLLSS